MLRVKNPEELEVLKAAVRTYVFRHRGTFTVLRPTFKELVEAIFMVFRPTKDWGDIVYNEDAVDKHIETIQHIERFDGPPQTIGYPQIANATEIQFRATAPSIFLAPLIEQYPKQFEFPHIRALWTLLPVLMFRNTNSKDEFTGYNPEQDILDFVEEYPFFVGEFTESSTAEPTTENTPNQIESKAEFKINYHIWLIGTGAKGEFWDEFRDQNIIALGWDDLEDFTTYSTTSEIQSALRIVEPEASNRNRASEVEQFERRIKPGDFVFARYGKNLLGLGIVLSNYLYREAGPLKHFRRVVWINTKAEALPSDSGISRRERFTLRELTRNKNNYDRLKEFIERTCNQTGPSGIYYRTPPDDDDPGQGGCDDLVENNGSRQNDDKQDTPGWWWFNISENDRKLFPPHRLNNSSIAINIESGGEHGVLHRVNNGDRFIVYRSGQERRVLGSATVLHKPDASGDDNISIELQISEAAAGIRYDQIRYHEDLAGLRAIKSPRSTLFKLSKEEYETILGLADTTDDDINKALPVYSIKDELNNLFVNEDFVNKCINNLKRKKNIILQGPPGVGKSYIAKKLAYELIGFEDDSKIARVQFHQSFGYEEFIHGYRPTSKGGFALQPGIFLKFVHEAQADYQKSKTNDLPPTPHVFIIDEVNRGNLSRILGECMSTIEHDKRDEGHGVQLLHTASHEPRFWIPENLYIIGMMNTADRSISLVDYALRRRFAFIDMEPQFENTRFTTLLKVGSDAEKDRIKGKFKRLNEEIKADPRLGKNYRIGHSYFCTEKELPEAKSLDDWYTEIINHEIEPLLHSYLPDDQDRVDELLKMVKQ